MLVLCFVVVSMCMACGGKKYTCYECDTVTKKAYYDMTADEEWVLCEDCAREYWMPLPYENYKVK